MKLILCLSVFLSVFSNAKSCTTFVLKNDSSLVYGRNLDWVSGNGVVVVNKRNVHKSSLVFPPEKRSTWTSKYGSVTFNQFGKEFPFGGMNEKGLVIATMLVPGTVVKKDNRTAVNELQWVQYQLDNAATIDQVIANCAKIRISKISQILHYLILDKHGNSVVIELNKNGMIMYKGGDLPIAVLENDPYIKSLSKNTNKVSCRFRTVAEMLKKYQTSPSTPAVQYSFNILDKVALDGSWSIVYDVNNLEIHFKTASNASIRKIKLNQFNFNCKAPSLLYDLQQSHKGNINSEFVGYTNILNTKKLDAGILTNRISLPSAVVNVFRNYNNTCQCISK